MTDTSIVWIAIIFLGSLLTIAMKMSGKPKPSEIFIAGWHSQERSWLINRAERLEKDRLGE